MFNEWKSQKNYSNNITTLQRDKKAAWVLKVKRIKNVDFTDHKISEVEAAVEMPNRDWLVIFSKKAKHTG